MEYVGLRGQDVFAPKEANYPTLFVDVRGERLVRRTFARGRSLTIDGKWVYVLRAEEPGGPATDVVAELSFRNGRFRPASPGKRGEDPWSTTTKEAKASEAGALPLQRAPVAQPARPYGYYFHLSPFQIPAQAFGRLKREAPTRAVRLDDSIHVDVHRILGQGLASASGPLQRFLRNCRFGNGGGWIDHTADFIDRVVDEPWNQGKKLSALKADLPGQLTALDEILYGFEVQVGNAGSRIILELKLQVPGQLTDMAFWKIEATVNRDGRKTPVNIDDAVLSSSPEEQARRFVTLMDADPPSIGTRSEGAAYVRDVSVEGWVTLDVRGGIFADAGSDDVPAAFRQAARPVIKREIKGAFRIGG